MNRMKSLVKEVIAILQGDNAEATGLKILRGADSALRTQIASLNGDTISLEDNVETAKEELALARINRGLVISDRNTYVSNLLLAKNRLTSCEEDLDAHKEKIAFLEEIFASLDK